MEKRCYSRRCTGTVTSSQFRSHCSAQCGGPILRGITPLALGHQSLHRVIPWTQGGHPSSTLEVFNSDSSLSASMRCSRPKRHPKISARVNSRQGFNSSRFYLTYLDHISFPPDPTRNSSITVLEREQAETAAAAAGSQPRSPPILVQNNFVAGWQEGMYE